MAGLNNKLNQIDLNIKAFIALHEFHVNQGDPEKKTKRGESYMRMNAVTLTTIDPLIGKIPENFEEEKDLLISKYKEA